MPRSVAAHALLATAYQSNEEHEKSARVAKALPTLQPVTLQDYLLLGQAQSGSDFAMGLATLDEAVQIDKTSVQARLDARPTARGKSHGFWQKGTRGSALEDLRIASELLEPNCYLLGNILQAHLIAATAQELAGNDRLREHHLAEADKIAEQLRKFRDQYQSHRWRGLYFEYIGDDPHALEAWLAMQEWQIAYLVLTLMRQGELTRG